jgi:Fe-S cluster biogenesis protein NfuA
VDGLTLPSLGVVFNQNVMPINSKERAMEERIKKVLEMVRPALQADGGDVEFIDFNDGIVTVRLQGACGSCPMSTMTLKHGIEARMREEIPEVKSVEAL